ncbi:MAG: cytochrome b [Steroidobacteraceae bacterium]
MLAAPLAGLVAWALGALSGPMQLLQPLPFAWPAVAVATWIVLAWLLRLEPAPRAGAVSWSGLSKLFHWVAALAILGTTALMYYMTNLGDTAHDLELRARYAQLLKLHKSIGLIALFLVAFRVAWNHLRARPPLPAGTTPAQARTVALAHGALYLGMLAVPLLGWTASMTYGGRTSFFGLFELPVWLPKDDKAVAILHPAHIWSSWALLALVGGHAAVALWHHLAKRDATLVQMLPGRR